MTFRDAPHDQVTSSHRPASNDHLEIAIACAICLFVGLVGEAGSLALASTAVMAIVAMVVNDFLQAPSPAALRDDHCSRAARIYFVVGAVALACAELLADRSRCGSPARRIVDTHLLVVDLFVFSVAIMGTLWAARAFFRDAARGRMLVCFFFTGLLLVTVWRGADARGGFGTVTFDGCPSSLSSPLRRVTSPLSTVS